MRQRVKKQKSLILREKFNIHNLYRDVLIYLSNPEYSWLTAILLLVLEVLVTSLVIYKIPYTEIDWKAYMQEVEGVVNGTLDYKQLKGDTGPLVYPAGFIYIYMIFYAITDQGRNIFFAQIIFAVLYLSTLCLVFKLYTRSKLVPPYALLFMCCTSYRIHSIYVLRLFNDPVAIFFLFVALNCFVDSKWFIGAIFYSFAVSIKMNILLFAPGLLFILLYSLKLHNTIIFMLICGLIQVIVGLPFLISNPVNYISSAFDLGRVFLHEWTVNWRFVPEEIFVDPRFHIALLACHLIFLVVFTYKWIRNLSINRPFSNAKKGLSQDDMLFILFTSNFVGMVFSRSLHYQFYVWYFFTLPHLLWSTNYNPVVKLCTLGVLELTWNTYPSTVLSSGFMHLCHLVILCGLLFHNNIHKSRDQKAM